MGNFGNYTKQRKWVLAFFVFVLFIGYISRFPRLGKMDTRADEVELLQFLQSGISVTDYLKREIGAYKEGRQMPLSRFVTSVFVRTLNLPPTLLTIRLPFAIMGLMCIPAFWLLGNAYGGQKLAFIMAWLAAINPYLAHWSKVAHNYSFVMCLFTFASAAFAFLVRDILENKNINKKTVIWFCISSILACYTHMSAWPAIILLWLSLMGHLWIKKEKDVKMWKPIAIGFGLLMLSLLPWIFIFISALFTAKESFIPPNADTVTQFKRLIVLPLTMTWGGGWRMIFSLGLPLVAIVSGFFSGRVERNKILFVCISTLLVFLALFTMQYFAAGNFDAVRYYTPVWTSLMLLSGIGITTVAELLGGNKRQFIFFNENVFNILFSGVLSIAMIHPLIWTVTLPATSIPYTIINEWMDTHLPEGTLVLVDRWLEPWNEMKTHAPKKVIVTFTIPNEPVEVFKKYRWRDTAMQFLTRYPDSAYLELVKQYFFDPEVGWWTWPREYFKRHIAFTNQQALALASINMMPNPVATFAGSNTNRIITELFYNTREDVIDIAREEGRQWVLFYSAGWGYIKLWPQVQDFRDWRVMWHRAKIEVFNISEQTARIKLRIRGVAPTADKNIRVGDNVILSFPRGQLRELDSQEIEINTGPNIITISGVGHSSSTVPLLVEEITIHKVGKIDIHK